MDLVNLRKRATQESLSGNYWADQVVAVIDHLREVTDEYDDILTTQSDLLTRTANALKGQPPERTHWSHHDVPELAAKLKAEAWKLVDDLTVVGHYPDSAFAESPLSAAAHDFVSRNSAPTRQGSPASMAGGDRSNARDTHSEGTANDNESDQTEESS